MKLNALISRSGFCSRRRAALLIKEGKVTVNGKSVREPWLETSESDSVSISGESLKPKEFTYLAFNKPKGVTTTLEDKFASKKISDFIPKKFGRLYPVGRLDKNSTGLIILTNDGDLCHKMTHPKFEIEKEYLITVKGRVDGNAISAIKKGVIDEGDLLKAKYASIERLDANTTTLSVVVSEGKKRHLRRLLKALGFTVIGLKRVRIGTLVLGNLKEGSFRVISARDVFKSSFKPVPKFMLRPVPEDSQKSIKKKQIAI